MSRSSRRPAASHVATWLASTSLLVCLATTAYAQRDKKPPKKPEKETWREDPYTDNKQSAVESAGYELLDRITWSEGFGSERVEQALGEVKIRWVETPHFRLGVCLPGIKVPSHPKKVRNRYREELAALKVKLPKVNVKTKKLDPWLRTHIYAHRLEKLYSEFVDLIGATDETFPTADKPHPPGPKSFGRGPYLGCKSKFNVLILTKEGDCRRFLTTFTGADGSGPSRWYLDAPHDGFVFGTAIEYTDGAYEDDTALYCHIAFNMINCMIDAYRSFAYRSTCWWQEGYAHHVRRGISDEFNMFSQIANATERTYRQHNWEFRMLGTIKHGLHRPMSDLAVRFKLDGMKFVDHLGMWSRVEFLLERDKAAFGKFITEMKGCLTAQGAGAPEQYQLDVQERALRELFGLDLESFDQAWIQWAKKAYKGKK